MVVTRSPQSNAAFNVPAENIGKIGKCPIPVTPSINVHNVNTASVTAVIGGRRVMRWTIAVIALSMGCNKQPPPVEDDALTRAGKTDAGFVPRAPFDSSQWAGEPFTVKPDTDKYTTSWLYVSPLSSKISLVLNYPTTDRTKVEEAARRVFDHYRREPLLQRFPKGERGVSIRVYCSPPNDPFGDSANLVVEGFTALGSDQQPIPDPSFQWIKKY